MAWDRVAGNKGARSAGVDGMIAASVRERTGEEQFLAELREQLKSGSFRPLPVRERMIPKPGTRKRRRLGIPTVADRVVQASLKLVLELIFEADFVPCSYGFRPNRRAHDAMAETRFLASKTYEWVLEGDITACFDEISIGDKRVLALVKAFGEGGHPHRGWNLQGNGHRHPSRGGSCRRCWRMWPSRSSTSTSPRSRAGRRPARSDGSPGAREGYPTTG
ncbi:reverse transcriptase domain-containing protein [Rhodococcus opacus]